MNLNGLYTLGFSLPGINWWGKDTGGPDVVKFLQDHESVLVYQDWLGSFFASIKWSIIKLLYHLDNSVFKLVPKAFDVRKIFSDAGFTGLKTDLLSGGLIAALLTITVIWFFVKKTVMPNDTAGLKSAFTHLIVAVALIVSTGTIVDKALDLSQGVFNAAVQSDEGSLPFKIVKDNTLDVFELAKNGWRTTNIVESSPDGNTKVTHNENKLDEKTFDTTDMTNVINKDTIDNISDDNDDSKRVKDTLKKNLLYRLDHTADNEAVAAKIDNGNPINDLYMPGYARFVAPAHIIIIGLISLGIACFFVLYTIVKIILQLAIGSILANLVYATDIESGQRTKAVVVDLMNTAAVIGFTGIEFYFYSIFLSWIPKNINNPILYVMALIAITMVLIFGSNAVLRYFNVDTAMKNNGSGLFKAAVGANMAAHAAKTGLSAVGNVGGKVVGGARQGLNRIRGEESSDSPAAGDDSGNSEQKPNVGLGTRMASAFGLSQLSDKLNSNVQEDRTTDSNTKTDNNSQSARDERNDQKTAYKALNQSDNDVENDTERESSKLSQSQSDSEQNKDSQNQTKSDLNTIEKAELQGNNEVEANGTANSNQSQNPNGTENVVDENRPNISEQTEAIKKLDSETDSGGIKDTDRPKISEINNATVPTANIPNSPTTQTNTPSSDQKITDANIQAQNNITDTNSSPAVERNTNLNENRNVDSNLQSNDSNNRHDDDHLSSEREISSEIEADSDKDSLESKNNNNNAWSPHQKVINSEQSNTNKLLESLNAAKAENEKRLNDHE
ncbi:pLS20_p028 family conjugation system transmembrane protein [Bombilactobacillus bombi]|uniref:pLS20_p028 family conjugation system transmembrane protein n=1 Tax=Bombilactobacillus bombi TaxID=1303590 RepID=UPI0035F0CC91